MEWDGRVRGRGCTNVGAPQKSPVSPVLFLIWMAPIIAKMERQSSKPRGLREKSHHMLTIFNLGFISGSRTCKTVQYVGDVAGGRCGSK